MVNEERMLANLSASYRLVFSGAVLLALVDKGMLREDAYRVVQDAAMRAWREGVDFGQLIKDSAEATAVMTPAEVDAAMDPAQYTRRPRRHLRPAAGPDLLSEARMDETQAPSHIRPATRGDLPEVVELLVACDVAQLGRPDTTPEDVESDWGADGFDLATQTWVAHDNAGAFLGYAYAGDQMRNGEIEADLWVHPQNPDDGPAGPAAGPGGGPGAAARRRLRRGGRAGDLLADHGQGQAGPARAARLRAAPHRVSAGHRPAGGGGGCAAAPGHRRCAASVPGATTRPCTGS